MTSPAGVTDAAASLNDITPELGRIVGARAAAALGARRSLSVLTVEAGPWTPPEREALEADTLVVLDGWLLGEDANRRVLGPGDRVEPWDPACRWTACTRVRLAILGRAFSDTLRPWPGAADALRAGRDPTESEPAASAPEDRILRVLWRLANRWGTLEDGCIALPRAVDAHALGWLTATDDGAVAATLAHLAEVGALRPGRRGGWLLPGPGQTADSSRGDELRARTAEQLAVARAATGDFAAIAAELETTRRQS